MAAVVNPYVAWMSNTAFAAAHTASQARAAASAFEAAYAATVPPWVVAANRAQLTALVATNLLGLNTPAIMATEAHYGEMWAQDAAAMYGYAGASAAAAQLTPWVAPLHNASLGGLAALHSALTQAGVSAAASTGNVTLPQLLSAVPQTLQSLASPTGVSGLLGGSGFSSTAAGLADIAEVSEALDYGVAYGINVPTQMLGTFAQVAKLVAPTAAAVAAEVANPFQAMAPYLSSLASAVNPASVMAGMGQAKLMGAVSVPASWAPVNPINQAATAAAASALPHAQEGLGNVYGGVPLANAAARGFSDGVNGVLKLPPRAFAMPRPPTAG